MPKKCLTTKTYMIKSIKIQTFHSLASSYSKSFPPMIWFLLIKNLHDISRSITHIWTLKLSLESKKNKLETQNVRERERRTCDGGEGARVLKGGEEGELRGSKGGGGGEERGFGWEWGRKTMWYLWRAQMGEKGEMWKNLLTYTIRVFVIYFGNF